MKFILKLYRQYIYGVIGTLVFHIVVFSSLLLAELEIKGKIAEEEILIEFPDNLPEPEQKPDPERDSPSDRESERNNMSNAASNRLATQNATTSTEKFFNNEFQKELNEAKNLVSDVNKQLAKEKTDLSKIKMPVQSTEGMNPDSIKNVIYAGESNIIYYLENRHHVELPIPVYLAQGGGKVIVDIVVNKQGIVIKATPRVNGRNKDEQIIIYAQAAAMRTVFNPVDSPASQSGSIHYNFVAQ